MGLVEVGRLGFQKRNGGDYWTLVLLNVVLPANGVRSKFQDPGDYQLSIGAD
jgi:hypothetical protein